MSIWGSPGFGKTSVAINVGHHLQSEGLHVYFLSLRGLCSKADLISKLLSFLRQTSSTGPSSQPLSLDDELCELFSRIVDHCVFILDNADHLFESGAADVKDEVVNILGEILGRNEQVTFILTTRESLEFMNIHFQGLQAVRIRPLDEHSSENLVHKLLAPNATSSDCNRITQICGHVPLAIKLLCSSISEDNAQPSQFLDEFTADKGKSNIVAMLDNPDYPSNLRLEFLFDSSFQRLSTQEKDALVSLSVLPENFSQEVAAAVLNLRRVSVTKRLQSLRRKSLIDSGSKPGSFQTHSLLQSFAREKGEQEMKETVLTSRARFYEFYISIFEKLNEQFLTGHSMSAFNEFYENKQCIIQSLTEGSTFSRTADIVFNVLGRAELFVSSVSPIGGTFMLYDSVIKAANNLKTNSVFYRQLIVSRALFEIPLGAEGATMQLLSKAKEIQALSASVVDGEEGKRLCYSGICHLVTGKTEQGVQVLKEALPLMEDIPNQTVLRLSVCQILAVYYRFKKDSSSFKLFYGKALQECKAAGDTQLLVIPEMEIIRLKTTNQENVPRRSNDNHPLQLEVLCFVTLATKGFSDFETKQFANNVALKILKCIETARAQHSSPGLSQFQRNVAYMFLFLNKIEDAAKLSEASINYHLSALKQCNSDQEELQRPTKHFPGDDTLHQESLAKSFWDLGSFHHLKENFSEAIQSHQSALDIRLKLFGEEHSSAAESYNSLGFAQLANGDFVSAFKSAKRALYIRLKVFGEEHSSTAESYLLLGLTQRAQGDITSAFQSYQCVLDIRLKLFGEEHSSIADIYLIVGDTQYAQDDFTSAVQSAKRALDIRIKLFGEEHTGTADSYAFLGNAQYAHHDFTSSLQSYQRALDIRLKLFEGEHSSVADSYVLLGNAQLAKDDFTSAIRSLQHALHIRIKLFGEEHTSTADSYAKLGNAQLAKDDFASAIRSSQHALHIRMKLFGKEHTDTADSYMSLGNAQLGKDDFASAIQSFEHALHIRIKLFGEEYTDTADTYMSLGNVQFVQGDFASAIQSFHRALHIRIKLFGDEHTGTADTYVSLGNAQGAQDDFTSALTSYQNALDIRRKLFGEEHKSTSDIYHRLAKAQSSQGDQRSALQLHQRALDIRLKLFGEEHSKTADSYNSLGQTQFSHGDLPSAVQSFKRALYITRKLFGEEHSSTAYSYWSLGGTQRLLGDLTSAFHSLQRSLVIRQKLFGEEHESTADSYHSLGWTQHEQGDFVSALGSKQCALNIRLKLFGEEHSSTADSYHSLGKTQRAYCDLTSALQSFKRALDIRLRVFGEEHSSTADIFESLGVTQCLQGNFTSALQSLQRALEITIKLMGEEHPNTADLVKSLGITQRAQGDSTSALQSFQRAFGIRLKLFGEEHLSTADLLKLLEDTRRAQGDLTSRPQ